MKEYIPQALGLVGVVATGALTYLGTRAQTASQYKAKLAELQLERERLASEKSASDTEIAQLENELKFQREGLSLFDISDEWISIEKEINAIIDETPIDRVLIFRSHNGAEDHRFTTAIRQYRGSGYMVKDYISVEIDPDYQGRMSKMETKGVYYFEVGDLPDCLIRDIYTDEGVHAAFWVKLYKLLLHETKATSRFYMSCATHAEVKLSGPHRTRVKLLASRIKALALEYHGDIALV